MTAQAGDGEVAQGTVHGWRGAWRAMRGVTGMRYIAHGGTAEAPPWPLVQRW